MPERRSTLSHGSASQPFFRLLSSLRSRFPRSWPFVVPLFVVACTLLALSPGDTPPPLPDQPASSTVRWKDRISSVLTDTLRHPFRRPPRASFCEPIPSSRPEEFHLELCHVPSGCNEGVLRIVRLQSAACRPPFPHPSLINVQETPPSIAQSLGPDTFRFGITGRIRAAGESRPSDVRFIPSYRPASTSASLQDKETCAYEFPFSLGRVGGKGKVGFSVEWYYRDWTDRLETKVPSIEEKFPITNRTSLVEDGKPQDAFAPAVFYPTQSICPSGLDRSLEALPRRLTDIPSSVKSALLARTSPCSSIDPFVASTCTTPSRSFDVPVQLGDYLPAPFEDRGKTYNGYSFQPRGCRWGEVPTLDMDKAEVRRRWTVGADGEHGVQRSILFLGDSHLRYLHHYFQAVFAQDAGYINSPHAHKENFDTQLIDDHLNITYIWSTHLDPSAVSCDAIKTFDSFVLSAGQHFLVKYIHSRGAEYDLDWTSSAYADRVVAAFSWIRDCVGAAAEAPKFVFVGPPAFPPPLNRESEFEIDRRQNGRIWRWTYTAFSRLRQSFPDIALVDQFALSHPMLWDNIQDFHFWGTDAIHAASVDLSWKLQMERKAK